MIDVAYVILHYQALEETKSCVESILKYHGNDITRIVVVDNASPNGSGLILKENYKNDDMVIVLLNNSNLGFSNGLNVGISYLRDNYETSFIVLLNNDTELMSPDWDRIIMEKFNKFHYAALGPDIVSFDGLIHSNPSMKQDTSKAGIRRLIKSKRREKVLYKLHIRPFSIKIRTLVKKIIGYNSPQKHINSDEVGVQLQGSCIILSPIYFEAYNLLYEKTFLYFEEAILRYRSEKINSYCVYTPDLILLHKGSVSVNGSMKNQRMKQLFYLHHSEASCKNFLEDIISGDE